MKYLHYADGETFRVEVHYESVGELDKIIDFLQYHRKQTMDNLKGLEPKVIKVPEAPEALKAIDTKETFKFDKPKLPRLHLLACCDTEQYILLNGDETELHCRICNDKSKIEDRVRVESICPKCGKRTVMTTSKTTKSHTCKDCNSMIDLVYNEKVNQIKSAGEWR